MSFFPDVPKIKYEGPDSKNPLAFRHYNPDEMVEGKSMKDHLRFAVCYWHTFRGTGGDPFGPGCAVRPWEDGTDSRRHGPQARRCRLRVHREARRAVLLLPRPRRRARRQEPRARPTRTSTRSSQDAQGEAAGAPASSCSGARRTSSSNPRFVHGAATSCNADVFAYAAAQVKKALEVTKELGGENYVFWGGREGYQNLSTPTCKRELDHLATFLHLAVEYKKKIGFNGQFLIEPKPKEPTTHQYDFDCRRVLAFLRDLRPGQGLQAQRRDQPRHARRPHDDARTDLRVAARHARLASTPTAATCCSAGTPTSSRPTCT